LSAFVRAADAAITALRQTCAPGALAPTTSSVGDRGGRVSRDAQMRAPRQGEVLTDGLGDAI
jgi:hypothetical protein